jgi:hypothetical protein
MKTQGGSRGIALLFLYPLCQLGVGGQCHAPANLPPGMTWRPLYRRLYGTQGWSGQMRIILLPPGFGSHIVVFKIVPFK